MKLLISRHGDCKKEVNEKGFPQILGGDYDFDRELTESGFAQAEELSRIIFQEDINAAYSSNLVRAIQTAETALKYTEIQATRNELLNERNFGSLSGVFCDEAVLRCDVIREFNEKRLERLLDFEYRHQTLTDYLQDLLYGQEKPNINATTIITINHDFPLEHVERVDAIKKRITLFEGILMKNHTQKENIAIFTHGDVIRCWFELVNDNPNRYSLETYQQVKDTPSRGRYRSVGDCEVFTVCFR